MSGRHQTVRHADTHDKTDCNNPFPNSLTNHEPILPLNAHLSPFVPRKLHDLSTDCFKDDASCVIYLFYLPAVTCVAWLRSIHAHIRVYLPCVRAFLLVSDGTEPKLTNLRCMIVRDRYSPVLPAPDWHDSDELVAHAILVAEDTVSM